MSFDYDAPEWIELANHVKERDDWRCARCESPNPLGAHHAQPINAGGRFLGRGQPDNAVQPLPRLRTSGRPCRRNRMDDTPGGVVRVAGDAA